jgi:dsDNA-specific endonuclease/ATPase MutS2
MVLKSIRQQKRNLQNSYDREKKNIISCIEKEVGIGLKLSGEVTVQKRDNSLMEKAKGCPWLVEESSTLLTTNFKLKKSEELIRLQDEIEGLKLQEEKEEYKVRQDLSAGIRANLVSIYGIINCIGDLDLLTAKAEFSNEINGVRPVIHDGLWVEVENGRYIKLEKILKSQGKVFTGVTCPLKSGVTVITGANMGGKTVRLKLMGMLQAMTQYGLYVPAEKFDTCLFDYVYFSIGDMQSIDSGLSTFGAEIKGMMDILEHSEYSGLILIDELARGTNPNEGYAISRAITRYLKNKNSITLFTTHFSGITREDGVSHLRVRGLKRADLDKLKTELAGTSGGMELVQEYMDYTLEIVVEEYDVPKDALNIARLMGLDEKILGWAEEILLSGREE